jgi:hypothetical protein
MSKTYRWGIENLKIAKSLDGLSNVITKIYYRRSLRMIVNDVEHNTHYFGEFKLAPANPIDFIEYQNLTQEQLFSWLDNILPIDFINSRLDDYMAVIIQKNEIEPYSFQNVLLTQEVDPSKLPNSQGGQIGI